MTNTIVIAHYDEDLNWCLNLDTNFNIKIYSKTNKNYNFIDFNKGQEVPMYIKYIIDNYYNLPDKILFLHGHQMSYHQDFSSDYIIKNVNWNISNYFSVNRRNSYQEVSSSFQLSENSFNVWLRNNWYIFENELPFPENGLFFYPNAQFVVAKECILQYTIDFWKKLYNWIITTDLDNVITSRIFEYAWHYIFTKNTNEKIINDVFINKNLKTLSTSLINLKMENEKIHINPSVDIGDCLIEIKNLKTELSIYKCNMTILNGLSYWIQPGPNKHELPGIIISIYKNSILPLHHAL